MRDDEFNLTGIRERERLAGATFTQNVLPLSGVRPIAGRLFTREEDQPGGAPVALIGYSLLAAALRRGRRYSGVAAAAKRAEGHRGRGSAAGFLCSVAEY
jgi:hypothetical protein